MLNKKIIYVEDSQTLRRMMMNFLFQIGFNEIVYANNGLDALEKIKSSHFDIILTDWDMPGMNGIELVKQLRANDKYKLTPIIMVSTKKNDSDIRKAFLSGINDYIIKPFSRQVLEERIIAQFNRQKNIYSF